MSGAWAALARDGNPADRATMVFDTASKVVNDFRGEERRLLAPLPL